jgi:hypothetical protein
VKKLSEQLLEAQKEIDSQKNITSWLTVEYDDISNIQQLEVDSQMLNDLIEMYQNGAVKLSYATGEFKYLITQVVYEEWESMGYGNTPREAIEAAIQKWKEDR